MGKTNSLYHHFGQLFCGHLGVPLFWVVRCTISWNLEDPYTKSTHDIDKMHGLEIHGLSTHLLTVGYLCKARTFDAFVFWRLSCSYQCCFKPLNRILPSYCFEKVGDQVPKPIDQRCIGGRDANKEDAWQIFGDAPAVFWYSMEAGRVWGYLQSNISNLVPVV